MTQPTGLGPLPDPWPPTPEVADHPLVRAVRTVAEEVLAPYAARADRHGVPVSHLATLADHGLLGAPLAAAPRPVAREVAEVLAGACGSTWFVAAQHATPYRMVAASDNDELRGRVLPGLADGSTPAGIVLAHLRRRTPSITATRSADGWVLRGVADWCTGWGLVAHVLVGAVAGDRHVFALLPARTEDDGGPRGLGASEPMAYAAMRGARTSRLFLCDVPVSHRDVVAVADRADWLAVDAIKTSDATPASFGVLRRVVGALTDLAERRGDAPTVAAATALRDRAVGVRATAYRLADADASPAERVAVRGAALALLVEASAALVVARGGAAMGEEDPASRWAREALFHCVQAQSQDVRAATLDRLG